MTTITWSVNGRTYEGTVIKVIFDCAFVDCIDGVRRWVKLK